MFMSLVLFSKFLWCVVLCCIISSLMHKFVVWTVVFLIFVDLMLWLAVIIHWGWPEVSSCIFQLWYIQNSATGNFVLWRLLWILLLYDHGLNSGLMMTCVRADWCDGDMCACRLVWWWHVCVQTGVMVTYVRADWCDGDDGPYVCETCRLIKIPRHVNKCTALG
jgi:hypothetical protein